MEKAQRGLNSCSFLPHRGRWTRLAISRAVFADVSIKNFIRKRVKRLQRLTLFFQKYRHAELLQARKNDLNAAASSSGNCSGI